MKCRRRQVADPQKLKKIVNGRFCWWKRKRLKNNRFHIPGCSSEVLDRRWAWSLLTFEGETKIDFGHLLKIDLPNQCAIY